MRGAALIFGLLAGLLGAAAIALGNVSDGLNTALTLGDDVIAKSILYGVLVVGLIGAGLILLSPKVGGAIMILSALGWAAAAFLAGHGAILAAALPFIFVAAGGLVALFARPRVDADDEIDDAEGLGPPSGLRRRLQDDGLEVNGGPSEGRSRGRGGIRAEPEFDAGPSRGVPTRYRDEPADYADQTDDGGDYVEENYVDADPTLDDERPGRPDRDDYRSDDDDEREYRDEPRGNRSRREPWALPDPRGPQPRRPAAEQRYVPERQPPAPSRRQPLPPRADTRTPRRLRDEDDDYERPDAYSSRQDAPRSRNASREVARYEEALEEDERRQSPLRRLVRILILLVFTLIVFGIAAWIYLDYQRGSQSVLFGTGGHPAAETTSSAPTTPAASAAPATPAPQAPSPAPAPTTPSAAAGSASGSQPVPLAGAAATDAVSTADMSSPFDYCRVVDTTDAPDDRYTGPAIPPAVASALSFSKPPPANQVFWRCAGQAVYACNSKGGHACDLTPTVDLMLSYCGDHPDAKNLPAPNGTWSCNGKRPSIPRDQEWPVDSRGFFPGAWARVAPTAG